MTASHEPAELERRVHAFITSNFLVPDPASLTPTASLLDLGVVDSTGFLEVFAWLRDEFGVNVADEEMLPANFETIANIVAYIARKRGPAA